MSKWLKGSVIVGVLALSLASGILASCAIVPGSHKEQKCTLVFQTPKMIVSPEGVLQVDQREVVSLTCTEVWVSPEEEQ